MKRFLDLWWLANDWLTKVFLSAQLCLLVISLAMGRGISLLFLGLAVYQFLLTLYNIRIFEKVEALKKESKDD